VIPVGGPFLLLGVVAWVVAIVLGVGAWMGLTDWRRHWSLTGGLAGFGTFELYLYANGGMLPVLLVDPSLAFAGTAALFVGCGVAAMYGTLFVPGVLARPRLEAGTAEEALWLHDAVDRIRPTRLDWVLTAALMLPAAGMLHLGIDLVPSTALVLAGVAGLLGPVFGLGGLLARRRRSERLLAELEERQALSETVHA
jgi:hypothetical protein